MKLFTSMVAAALLNFELQPPTANVAENWLKFSFHDYSDAKGKPPLYELTLLPSDIMSIRYLSHEQGWVTLNWPIRVGTFISLDKLIEKRWPAGTVQAEQCKNDLDHNETFHLVLSSVGRHVSTAWYGTCLRDSKYEKLKIFSNSLRELLDIESVEKELIKRGAGEYQK